MNPHRHNKQIVAYYPNWQWYRRNQLVNPETILYSNYTVINYAFFRPLANGSIQSTDTWADEALLLGPMIWYPEEMHDQTKSLPYLCHQNGVKLLPSIGGWNDSVNFPQIAASSSLRQIFVESCISLINTYQFDGIDIDWEYPGFAANNGSPADMQNFTLLLTDLRVALDDLELITNQEYILSACFGSSQSNMQYIEWDAVTNLVDMINLMSYDFHGPWDSLSNHHTPLYAPSQGDPLWCLDGAFNLLTQNYQVPSHKINIGMAFYGKALSNCSDLYATHTGYDNVHFSADAGQPHYYTILNELSNFEYHWDDQVKCPYLTSQSLNCFITYDNETSIEYKVQYVNAHNVLGVIIWELTGDYTETSSGSGIIDQTPLAELINNTFNQNLIPYNLRAVYTGTSIVLNWDFASDNPNSQFKVYRNNLCLTENAIQAMTYNDLDISAGNTYTYYVTYINGNTESQASDTVSVTVLSAEEVSQNDDCQIKTYPNPVVTELNIICNSKIHHPISLDIYNIKGQKVKHLYQGDFSHYGQTLSWDKTDDSGCKVANGIYMIRFQQGNKTISKKILLLK
ncbi:MAG: T9SS type A sorting domain-containing protein [Candidatus Cloacimonetes bacterium]|nr:T9SS type A sorting domain-containing protein [Candidatus Cloacimonadota bacterium]